MQETLFYHLSYCDKNGEQKVFYIGRTGLGLKKRLAQHKSAARRKETANARFIRQLEEQKHVIEITELHRVNSYERKIVETEEDRLIKEYLLKGCQLTNKGTGGFGLVPGECRKNILWTEEMESLLGQISDREIAEQFKITRYAVMTRRIEKNIPALPYTEWTPEMDALLGTMTDIDLGEHLNVCYQIVGRRRNYLGIPVYTKPDPWQQIDRLLGTMPDKDLARMVGFSTGTIAKRRRMFKIARFLSGV